MTLKRFALTLALLAIGACAVVAAQREEAVLAVINNYRPGSTGFGDMKVKKVTISTSAKTITVACNDVTANLPLTLETMQSLKDDIRRALGNSYRNYTVTLTAGRQNLDDLVLFAPRKIYSPVNTPNRQWVQRDVDFDAPDGLSNANIALWQSHGWYFEPKLNRWEWQRARVMQTVEDLYTQSYVMPFLMPMLENAGAYVMSPRERDTNPVEIIIDADNAATPGYSETNGKQRWSDVAVGFAWDGKPLINGSHPHSAGKARRVATVAPDANLSRATWSADIPVTAPYAVYVTYPHDAHAGTVAYTIHTAAGDKYVKVNQAMGAGTWVYLGHYVLAAGDNQVVIALDNSNVNGAKVVTADAVKIGGGMGIVSRIVKEPLDSIDYQYVGSGYPKFTEGARYFLQWAGAPDSVFTPTEYVNDYNDDYMCRGRWVNWLAGGSDMLPGREGLGVPIDLSLAFHTDAGTFTNDSIVGTLGIYCSKGDGGSTSAANGTDRLTSRDYTDLVMTNIVRDVRAAFEPSWTRRGLWDKSYAESRIPEVPAMLLELLSHQNFADMKYGLDPAFRFVVSRAIYKGMLQFLAHRDGRDYVVQPLPVHNFAITAATEPHTYRLSWSERVDSLEPTAHPTHYIIEHRVGDAPAFVMFDTTEDTHYDVTITDTDIHSYRIIAVNRGGASFASEVLALCDLHNDSDPVLVVNGFTRVSAPDCFEASEAIAGFYDQRDHGVPYISDISFIGSQFEFRRDIPWMDDDAAGFGASRANYETQVIAGNTFDYVYTHGEAIAAAGHSFISSSVEAYCNADAAGEPRIVDLILGKQKEIKRGRGIYGTCFKTFPAELQAKITTATAAGTDFLITGAFVATDLWDNPNSDAATIEADKAFTANVLGYNWRVGQATVEGRAYQVPCRFDAFSTDNYTFSATLNTDCYAVESPDSFYAADPARGCTLFRYNENNLIAGVAVNFDNYRTVVIGFPFETITEGDARNNLMKQVLKFFSK